MVQICRQQIPLRAELADHALDVTGCQCHAEHFPRRFRQLVGFIYDDDAVFGENGAPALTAVDGVCQQQVMVADLENIAVIIAAFQEAPVPAVLMAAIADLRNADTLAVVAAEMRDLVHVQRILQGAKGVGCCRIFLLEVYLTKPPLQALVANIVTFSFADHREQGPIDLSIRQQRAGQQRKVFRLHGVLQRYAGSGDNDGPVR